MVRDKNEVSNTVGTSANSTSKVILYSFQFLQLERKLYESVDLDVEPVNQNVAMRIVGLCM